MRITIGVDPGASGGWAIAWGSLDDVSLGFWSGEADFLAEVWSLIDHSDSEGLTAVVEHVPPFVGKNIPSSSGFKLGYNAGFICGTFRALQIPLHLIRPAEWQKGLPGVRGATGARKKRLLKDHALRLYPKVDGITLKTADALLVLHVFLSNQT